MCRRNAGATRVGASSEPCATSRRARTAPRGPRAQPPSDSAPLDSRRHRDKWQLDDVRAVTDDAGGAAAGGQSRERLHRIVAVCVGRWLEGSTSRRAGGGGGRGGGRGRSPSRARTKNAHLSARRFSYSRIRGPSTRYLRAEGIRRPFAPVAECARRATIDFGRRLFSRVFNGMLRALGPRTTIHE